MAKFKKILSFLKGSKKRKSVVIHDSRSIRNNEIPLGGLAGNGNVRFGVNTGRPIVGNGGHYEQFLYIDDVKNGGLKKRTLSVAPSVVSSSNYTQTDYELSDTLSHLRSESSKFDRHVNRNGKSITNRKNIGNSALNKNTNTKNSIKTKKVNKSFILKQDPIEEERVIVEIQDNNEDEIEIDEDELIAAIEEFDKERNSSNGKCPLSPNSTDHGTFIIKEDVNGNSQSFIIKSINDDIHTKKLSFILSSPNQQDFNIDETDDENGNSLSSILITSPNITYSIDKSNDDANIEVNDMENMKKDYITNNKESVNDKDDINTKDSLIQFQPPEFSITNEKVYDHRNNDIVKNIFKKIPHNNDIVKANDSDEEDNEVLGNIQNKKKVNFVINNKLKANTQNNSTLTKNLSTKSSDFIYTPKPILIPSPKLNKSSAKTITNNVNINELVNHTHSLNNQTSIKRINSTSAVPKTKTSDESLSHKSSKKDNINKLNEKIY